MNQIIFDAVYKELKEAFPAKVQPTFLEYFEGKFGHKFKPVMAETVHSILLPLESIETSNTLCTCTEEWQKDWVIAAYRYVMAMDQEIEPCREIICEDKRIDKIIIGTSEHPHICTAPAIYEACIVIYVLSRYPEEPKVPMNRL